MDRILEIGGYAAGFCGRLFVKNGHEVVRVEGARSPAWASAEAMDVFLHAGKRRLVSKDRGRISALAAEADVVILEAATADEIDEWEIDTWPTAAKVAITPFGRTGPKRNWAATPSVILAMAGYTYLMGDPGRAPLSLPGHYVEFQTGQFAYVAATACRRRGEANAIDVGMLESVMALSQFTTVQWHCANRIRSRHGSDFWWVVPTNLFRCKDGWCYINIVPTFWDALATFLDKPELVIDPRFSTNDDRMANRDALHEIIDGALAQWTKVKVRARATESRIPLGVVQTFGEVLNDPHLAEREFWQEVRSDAGGSGHENRAEDQETEKRKAYKVPSLPFRLNNEPRPSFALTQPTHDAGFGDG